MVVMVVVVVVVVVGAGVIVLVVLGNQPREKVAKLHSIAGSLYAQAFPFSTNTGTPYRLQRMSTFRYCRVPGAAAGVGAGASLAEGTEGRNGFYACQARSKGATNTLFSLMFLTATSQRTSVTYLSQ
ncbi:hypothetical protein E2C01_098617 [Portunus trituberculatus]|uniref:Uncharacterized protein n=1 Tax=Portunus trituberculatus TaxID=210409 RepID=A0A5B7K8Q2_PORTR|nr:hypothetical protein [Portunus trituberculatus]